MRKKKQIVLFSMIFILNLTLIFSSAEQDKLIRKVTDLSLKDIYSIKEYFPPKQQYVPSEIVVKFNPTLSDYEIAQIIDTISSSHNQTHLEQNIERTGRDNVFRISIPENSSWEGMIDIFNRNPDVEYAEPNYIVRIQVPNNEHHEYFPKKIHPIKSKHIIKVLGKGLHKHIEIAPRAGGARQSYEALDKEEMLQKDVHGKTKKTQTSDNKSNIRSIAKIYKYRDSEGRLVITNYSLSKSNAKKK
jgi:hypothetical protein